MEENKQELQALCSCPCHSKKGGEVLHIMPCCNRTYEKYNE